MKTANGKLYLLPVPLGEDAWHTVPQYVIDIIHELDAFVVERAKTARHFLKAIEFPRAFDDCLFFELNKRTEVHEIPSFLQPTQDGRSVGLLSEAGVPAVADPGSQLVLAAHQQQVEVVPLVGPSSILLALMGAGMNGQSFAFKGYLSAKRPQLGKDLKQLEQQAMRRGETQVFIETPYRNSAVFETALQALGPQTLFSVAVDITLPTQWIKTMTIQQWRKAKAPDLHKRPAVFLVGSRKR
ncbi:MAG: SAM-dependent methyltransferase [Bacteroidota bacterium]